MLISGKDYCNHVYMLDHIIYCTYNKGHKSSFTFWILFCKLTGVVLVVVLVVSFENKSKSERTLDTENIEVVFQTSSLMLPYAYRAIYVPQS